MSRVEVQKEKVAEGCGLGFKMSFINHSDPGGSTSAFFFISTAQTPLDHARAMSVLLETSVGDITVDLLVAEAPKACEK